MTISKMLEVLDTGDSKGSALKALAKFYHFDNYDISRISDEMADCWLHGENDEDKYEWGD